MKLELVLSIVDKLLAKTPNYDEKKKKQFYDLKLAYVGESKKTYPERDDDLLMNLRDQLSVWIEAFDKEDVQK